LERVLVVTGGSRGIGAAVVRQASATGWVVVFSFARRAAEAAALVRDVEASGGRAACVQADSTREDDVARLFDEASCHGRIAGVVNNAGMNGGPVRVADLKPAELRELLELNVVGYFLCAAEAVRRMSTALGGGGGVIVNIGSVGARRGAPGERVHYAASKGAVLAMSHGLALEVAREGIRVNCVSPGPTETDMTPPDWLARVAPGIPIGRAERVDEVASVVTFLLSDSAGYVLGANIDVSGGR
jgi:NAD(P)-dependent dehydrogenase (short-subunit alcohol dehydrogenase family)